MFRRAILAPFLAAFIIALAVLGADVLPTSAARILGSDSSAAAGPAVMAGANGCVYWIRPGDNLFRIGLRHGVSYSYLAQLNSIPNPNLIYAGSPLTVPCGGGSVAYPANCAPSQTYLVQPGDNLFRIALNHETGLDMLRASNNMYSRVLRPGLNLVVPCPGSVKYKPVPLPSGGENPPPTSTPTTPAPAPNTISMVAGQYNPAYLEVKVGTTVVWVNDETDGTVHSVTSGLPGTPNNLFNSGSIAPGNQFSFTFSTAGIYSYYSEGQPDMTGEIKVNP